MLIIYFLSFGVIAAGMVWLHLSLKKIKLLKEALEAEKQNQIREKEVAKFLVKINTNIDFSIDQVSLATQLHSNSVKHFIDMALKKNEVLEHLRIVCPECHYVDLKRYSRGEAPRIFGTKLQCKSCNCFFIIYRENLHSYYYKPESKAHSGTKR
jgi:hypothetical protein